MNSFRSLLLLLLLAANGGFSLSAADALSSSVPSISQPLNSGVPTPLAPVGAAPSSQSNHLPPVVGFTPSTSAFSSPELWCNRGLAEEKSGDPLAASLSFRRALLLDPTLVPARRELATVLAGLGLPVPSDWQTRVLTVIHPETLILGGAILGWIGVLLLVVVLMSSTRSATLIALALAAAILGHGVSIFGGLTDPRRLAGNLAVVTAKTAPTLRVTPADSAKAAGTLLPGSEITILSRNGSWWYVADGFGHTGWILANTVTPLLPVSNEG